MGGNMSFKENLLKKIEIDKLTTEVLNTIGPPESGRKIDKAAMRRLLEMGPYRYQHERDLDLYVKDADTDKGIIVVLDNELPIYNTTIEDVVMRKSPYIKEMVNIRNAIKILKDSDVKISIKQESVKTVQKESIDQLDLTFNESDIENIAKDGAASLGNSYAGGVAESLTLFAELLGYQPPPKIFQIRHHEIVGALTQKESGEIYYGPMIIYSLIDNSIKMIEEPVNSLDKAKTAFFQQVAKGNEKASVEGPDVFQYLKREVLKKRT
jgi:hypothetical protein